MLRNTRTWEVYVPRQSEKWARAPERAPGQAWKCGAPERAWAVLSWKMRGSATGLIRFERENASLRNWQERVWLAANPRRCRTLYVRAEPAMGGDEWVEIKEILKMMVSGTAKSAKQNGDAPERIFLVICENDMLRNGNSGLKTGVSSSRAAHTQYAYNMEVPPPPLGIAYCSHEIGRLSGCIHTVFSYESYVTLLRANAVNYLCLSACSTQQWNTRGLHM